MGGVYAGHAAGGHAYLSQPRQVPRRPRFAAVCRNDLAATGGLAIRQRDGRTTVAACRAGRYPVAGPVKLSDAADRPPKGTRDGMIFKRSQRRLLNCAIAMALVSG